MQSGAFPPPAFFFNEHGYANYELKCFKDTEVDAIDRFIEVCIVKNARHLFKIDVKCSFSLFTFIFLELCPRPLRQQQARVGLHRMEGMGRPVAHAEAAQQADKDRHARHRLCRVSHSVRGTSVPVRDALLRQREAVDANGRL